LGGSCNVCTGSLFDISWVSLILLSFL
jgi:hypothetical protein